MINPAATIRSLYDLLLSNKQPWERECTCPNKPITNPYLINHAYVDPEDFCLSCQLHALNLFTIKTIDQNGGVGDGAIAFSPIHNVPSDEHHKGDHMISYRVDETMDVVVVIEDETTDLIFAFIDRTKETNQMVGRMRISMATIAGSVIQEFLREGK